MKCSTCDKDKDESEFTYRKDRGTYESRCKACKGAANRERWARKRRAETEGERDAIARNPIPFFCAAMIERAILDRDNEWFETGDYKMLRDTANIEEDSVRRMREHVSLT